MTPRSVLLRASLTATFVLFVPAVSQAEESYLGAFFGVGTGLEMGDGGNGKSVLRRARTRLEGGLELRLDDVGKHGFGASAYAEIEPHTSFGTEVRYTYWLSRKVSLYGGVSGLLAPHWLIGAVAGFRLHLPVGGTGLGLYVQPSFSAMPFGSELPTERPLIWTLLTVGGRFDLAPEKRNDG